MFKHTVTRTLSVYTALAGRDDDGRVVTMADATLTPRTLDDSAAILSAIESFSRTRLFLMIMGRAKREFVAEIVARKNARTVLDIGAYCGYSALGVAQAAPAATVLSIEPHETYGDVAREVWAHAGATAKNIALLRGRLADPPTIAAIRSELAGAPVDVVLLDHDKDCYLADLLTLVATGIVGTGTTVVADNIRFPGAPEYRRFMQEHEGIDWRSAEHRLPHTAAPALRDVVLVSEYVAGEGDAA